MLIGCEYLKSYWIGLDTENKYVFKKSFEFAVNDLTNLIWRKAEKMSLLKWSYNILVIVRKKTKKPNSYETN